MVEDYFRKRSFVYTDKKGITRSCEVLQGSILEALLWNLAYDPVLRTTLSPGAEVICYADVTLILTVGPEKGQRRVSPPPVS